MSRNDQASPPIDVVALNSLRATALMVAMGGSACRRSFQPAELLELTEMLANSAGWRGMGSPATGRVPRAGVGARDAGREVALSNRRVPPRLEGRSGDASGVRRGAASTFSPPSRGRGAPGSPFARD